MAIGMVFPGQGSQSVGMQADLAAAFPDVRALYEEASEILGYDLWRIAQEGPAGRLGETEVTQPAMLVAAVAVYRTWRSSGGAEPAIVAGHSLGEYSALVCAGALPFREAVGLVRTRGQLMQAASPAGDSAMAAVLGLDDDTVREICDGVVDGVVEAVNFNAPGQVVIAGNKAAVTAAVDAAKSAGAKRALPLSVSVPSHSSLMAAAGEELASHLAAASFNEPKIPVFSSVSVKRYTDADDIRDALKRQVHSPVEWVRTVEALLAEGVETIVECGPGKVLAGLNRRIRRDVPVHALDDTASLNKALEETA